MSAWRRGIKGSHICTYTSVITWGERLTEWKLHTYFKKGCTEAATQSKWDRPVHRVSLRLFGRSIVESLRQNLKTALSDTFGWPRRGGRISTTNHSCLASSSEWWEKRDKSEEPIRKADNGAALNSDEYGAKLNEIVDNPLTLDISTVQ